MDVDTVRRGMDAAFRSSSLQPGAGTGGYPVACPFRRIRRGHFCPKTLLLDFRICNNYCILSGAKWSYTSTSAVAGTPWNINVLHRSCLSVMVT